MAQIGALVMSISKDIMELVRMVMESNNLINTKVGRNTIAPDSDIYKSLQVKATNDGDLVFDIMLNDYLTFIESGRRKGAKFPPVEPIVKWARKRGIPTDNSTIFLIRRAISRDGIRPRPFMQFVLEEIDTSWDDGWADEIFNKIMEEIDKYFNT
jgi:hypothetical protein